MGFIIANHSDPKNVRCSLRCYTTFFILETEWDFIIILATAIPSIKVCMGVFPKQYPRINVSSNKCILSVIQLCKLNLRVSVDDRLLINMSHTFDMSHIISVLGNAVHWIPGLVPMQDYLSPFVRQPVQCVLTHDSLELVYGGLSPARQLHLLVRTTL